MQTEKELLNKINNYISALEIARKPESLYSPVKYILSLGGKRMRPLLMLMAYNLYKEDVDNILSQAVAIEIYHNFTLLHDDLMDNSDMRRGKPTVHKVWDENTAILSGDAMLILSYHFLADSASPKLKEILDLFNNVSLEICEGQQYDMDFESRLNVSEEEYISMIRLKTAVLLATSLKIGAILGGATAMDADYLYDFGIYTGIAFQLKDDFLDVYGNPDVFGKKNGGDILCNKKTFMLIKALELADSDQKKELEYWLTQKEFDPTKKIEAVTSIYNKVGIKSLCERKMQEYYEKGLNCLTNVAIGQERKAALKSFAEYLMYREI